MKKTCWNYRYEKKSAVLPQLLYLRETPLCLFLLLLLDSIHDLHDRDGQFEHLERPALAG